MVDLFGGHVYPGCGFTIYGLWWSLTTAIRYIRAENAQVKKGVNTYRSSASMPIMCCPCSRTLSHPLVESVLKLVATLVGIVWHASEVEIETTNQMLMNMDGHAMNRSLILTHRTKHHVAIYIGFFLGAIAEILIFWGVRLPKKLDRALLVIQFGIEFLIFANHFHGRGHIDVQLHILHAFTIFAITFFCVMEAVSERQVIYSYGRCLFTILQGTWFWQIALTLYHPWFKWNLDDEELVANVTYVYVLHFFTILIFLFVELALVKALIGQASWFKRSYSNRRQRGGNKDILNGLSEEEDFILYEKNLSTE